MTAPQYEALLALQSVDTDLDRARHRRRTLPARAVLEDLSRRDADLVARRSPLQAEVDQITAREATLEADLAATEDRAAHETSRLYSGEVQASRDLQALSADVEALKARASDLEDRILAVLEERQTAELPLRQMDREADEMRAARTAAEAEVAAGEAEADAEVERLTASRAEAAGAVPADLVATYERLRARLGGVGAARLEGSRCGGCHLDLSATELDAVRHLPPDELSYCDQCGRILVRP